MKPVIDVEGLTVQYEEGAVLWDVSFSIEKGSLTAIVGPNGAGKSTLLKSLVNLKTKTSGRIHFFGKPYKKALSKIAYVPQRGCIDWDFPITALEVVTMGRYGRLGPLKWPRRADKEAALKIMERLGIAELSHRQISKLSGGQQQRLFLCRALLQEADLYLLDEPFCGIDLTTEKLLFDLFKSLRDEGKTVVVVHHDLSTVEETFDGVVMINKRLIAAGSTAQVFTKENFNRCYDKRGTLFDDVVRLSQEKHGGA